MKKIITGLCMAALLCMASAPSVVSAKSNPIEIFTGKVWQGMSASDKEAVLFGLVLSVPV